MGRNGKLSRILNHKKIENEEVFKMYTTFLRRCRKKLSLKQEQVANGICTVSYYCRIENNQVICDEEYLVHFFKNLNIDFYSLQEGKNYVFFEEILKTYLEHDFEKGFKIIEDALNNNFYADEEIKLMILYHDVCSQDFVNVQAQLARFKEDPNIFNDNENSFFLFTQALYYYMIKDINQALDNIDSIISNNRTSLICRNAAISLMLDIFVYQNLAGNFAYFFSQLNNNDFFAVYSAVGLHHLAQKVFFEINEYNYVEQIEKLKALRDLEDKEDLKLYINWLLIKIYIQYEEFNQAFSLLSSFETIDSKVIYYVGQLYVLTKNDKYLEAFNNLYDSYSFNKYESQYHSVCTAIRYYAEKEFSSSSIILKDLLKEDEIEKFDMIANILNANFYLNLSLEIGRYKECVVSIQSLLSLKGTFIK